MLDTQDDCAAFIGFILFILLLLIIGFGFGTWFSFNYVNDRLARVVYADTNDYLQHKKDSFHSLIEMVESKK